MVRHENLKKVIDDSGLKRSFVADRVGLQKTSLNQVLCGAAQLSLEKAIALSQLLKVPLDEIWTEAAS